MSDPIKRLQKNAEEYLEDHIDMVQSTLKSAQECLASKDYLQSAVRLRMLGVSIDTEYLDVLSVLSEEDLDE